MNSDINAGITDKKSDDYERPAGFKTTHGNHGGSKSRCVGSMIRWKGFTGLQWQQQSAFNTAFLCESAGSQSPHSLFDDFTANKVGEPD